MEVFIIILVYAVLIFALYKIAKSKNREPIGWILAAIIISPIIVIIVLALMQKLPNKKVQLRKRKKSKKL